MNIQYVHKSQLGTIKRCSQQFYYKDILKLKPEFINESALTGQSFHAFAEEIYKSDRPNKWDDLGYWVEFFVKDFQKRKEQCIIDNIDLNTVEDIKAEDFVEMIGEFLKQPYNRYAEPVLIEAPFRFVIKRGPAKYGFEGRIDQLLKINKQNLPNYMLYKMHNGNNYSNKDYVYIHRDIKTGNRKTMSEIGLTTDDNINIYAYALAFGNFDLTGGNNYTHNVHHIPYAHCLYYTRDHLKYKKNVGKLSDGNYEHKIGDYKGQAMYFVKKDLAALKMMEPELINLWKKCNSPIYTRDGSVSNLCDNYCGFKKMCLYDWKNNG